ncbi:hypothetical protein AKJ40_01315, partial [candidate division MSBL1 archaeon SCGC-AAA259M10]
KWEDEVNNRLSEGIPEDVRITEKAKDDLDKIKPKVKAIVSVKKEISEEKENFESLIQKKSKLDSALKDWKEIVKKVNIPMKAWNMENAVIPEIDDFDFDIFEDSENVRSYFENLQKCKKKVNKLKEITSEFDFNSSEDLEKEKTDAEELLETLKDPEDPPEDATEVLLTDPASGGKYPVISIPINEYRKNMQKVNRTPRVHKKEELSEEEEKKLETRQKNLEKTLKKLSKAKQNLDNAKETFKAIESDKSLPEDKRESLETKIENIQDKIKELRDRFKGNGSILYNRFDRGDFNLDFKKETSKNDFSKISEVVKECESDIKEEISKIIGKIPEKILEKLKKAEKELEVELSTESIEKNIQKLEKIIKDLKEERKKQKEIQEWLQKEKNNIQDQLKDLSYSKYILKNLLPYPRALYKIADEKVDLEKIVDRLGDYIQESVEKSYRNIIPDQTLEFVHKREGEFEPRLNGQYISNPSGSQRAAISFGIMYTLASQFNLPLVMDEAADRFDTHRLSDFLSLTQQVAEENKNMQICLTIYKTNDVSDSELEKANTYEVQGQSYSQKSIQPYEAK